MEQQQWRGSGDSENVYPSSESSRRVTIREVASEAGVSVATVSRTLSGNRPVRADVSARVLAAAQRLGYRTNRVARALRTRSTQTIGVVVPDIANPFFPRLIQAVEHELRGQGQSLVLADSGNDVQREAELLHNLITHQIDGLLICPCDRIASRHAVQIAAGQVPLVQVDRHAVADLHYVGVDQRDAMRQVIAHLAERRDRRFAYISPHPAISTAHERLTAYIEYAQAIDPDATRHLYLGDFTAEWGRTAAERILEASPLPDAIVCANDLTAVGALQALRDHGVAVPRDITITGFDDTILATAAEPRLTTVHQPTDKLAHHAVSLVRALTSDRHMVAQRVTFAAQLIVRESSGGS